MIPNLTKENFFDELESKFPEAVAKFKKWIDDYKTEVNWHLLFKTNEGTAKPINYKSIPIEMQCGIMGRFIVENMAAIPGTGKQNYLNSVVEYRSHLTEMFQTIQEDIKKQNVSHN